MHYLVLTADYDGTLATNDLVPTEIVNALINVKATGRKLVLVTGRELEELKRVFPEHTLFDRIVAENGALLYTPATMELKLLGDRPPEELISRLKDTNIPLSIGHVILSTWEPHHEEALEAIRQVGLEYQLIFNKGAVMILPPGINKASGLLEALKELDVSKHNTVAIGDAENDHAMLMVAEFSAAVSNALPLIKTMVDWTASKPCGAGVAELIDHLIDDDLSALNKGINRHNLILGTESDGSDFAFNPYGSRILLAGASSCGKTTVGAALVEKLVLAQYQLCIIDPEGDYRDAENVVTVGDATQPPLIGHIVQLLKQPAENVSICLLAVPLVDRPLFFKELLAQITALRQHRGHPHFLIVDEAHHLIPKEYPGEGYHFFDEIESFLAITTRSSLLNRRFLTYINMAMFMGESRVQEMESYAALTHLDIKPDREDVPSKEVLVWEKTQPAIRSIRTIMPQRLLKRHKRKYASGDMGYNSFYFNGPGHRLNLKAQNLFLFMQIGEGVDDDTWLYHLHRHDYSNWFRNSVKNVDLARLSEDVERSEHSAQRSRQEIFSLIRSHYTARA